jgi:hypothetical protein
MAVKVLGDLDRLLKELAETHGRFRAAVGQRVVNTLNL